MFTISSSFGECGGVFGHGELAMNRGRADSQNTTYNEQEYRQLSIQKKVTSFTHSASLLSGHKPITEGGRKVVFEKQTL